MNVFYKKILYKQIRPYFMYGLICFIFIELFACGRSKENNAISIVWKDNKAVGVSFARELTGTIPSDSVASLVEVRLLTGQKPTSILGDYRTEGEKILFSPLIPFTRGLHYEIAIQNKRVGTFDIPRADKKNAPELLSIFPSQDTLPENLLKIYLHFSQPMRESQSGRYVTLIKNNSDTVKGAFLDLQPELWNENRTILTLWLDPGRIKRELQPNKLLGAPLQKNAEYKIVVSTEWQDQEGSMLSEMFVKSFVTTTRDSLSPEPQNWKINKPKNGTVQALDLDFGEPLDHSLLNETLTITNQNGAIVNGKWLVDNEEKKCAFIPAEKWKAGHYLLNIEMRLEDLAGNNLSRPFDRDITKKIAPLKSGNSAEIPFTIE